MTTMEIMERLAAMEIGTIVLFGALPVRREGKDRFVVRHSEDPGAGSWTGDIYDATDWISGLNDWPAC